MYEKFFGFRNNPFQAVPNLDYLYLSDKHHKTLSFLEYGLTEKPGLNILTGPNGAGKTILSQYLSKRLDSNAEVALIGNSDVSQDQLLGLILSKFGLFAKRGRAATIDVMNQFLSEKDAEQKHVLLIVDEAQNLAAEAFEEICMLADPQIENQSSLKIMLVGEPQLIGKIKNSKLSRFSRGIAVHCRLTGLDRKETGEYIAFRLLKAGGVPDLFTSDAVDAIYRITGGIPGAINRLCQAALVYGYAIENRPIGEMTIEEIARDRIGIRLELQIEDIYADDVAQTKKEDEILQRIRVLEEKISALQGEFRSQLQTEKLNREKFKDNLIGTLLQLLVAERRRSEGIIRRNSQQILDILNRSRTATAIQNDKCGKRSDAASSECVSLPDQEKRKRLTE